MIRRKWLTAAEPAEPDDLPVAQVFPFGAPVYLRFLDHMHKQKLVMVNSLGMLGRSTVLTLKWVPSTKSTSSPPVIGSHLQCLAIVNGVLYTTKGRISGVINGLPLQLHVAVEGMCRGINLRRHVRFAAQGMLSIRRLARDSGSKGYTPLSLDISIGGFGAVVTDGGWEIHETIEFELTFVPVPWPGSQIEFSYLTLSGTALIRKRTAQPDSVGAIRIGCQFQDITQEEYQQLKLLLSTHGATLRVGEF